MAIQKLTALQVKHAGDGEHSDGGGVVLRVDKARANWVLRYTSFTGRRREMGLGSAVRFTTASAGRSLIEARECAQAAYAALRRGEDPIDLRKATRKASVLAEMARKADARKARHVSMTSGLATPNSFAQVLNVVRHKPCTVVASATSIRRSNVSMAALSRAGSASAPATS